MENRWQANLDASSLQSLHVTEAFSWKAAFAALAWCAQMFGAHAQTAAVAPVRDLMSDTWVATDAVGRRLPVASEVGAPRDRLVLMFYFLTADERTGDGGPYDNTAILHARPEAISDIHDPAWGPLNSGHFWGKPLLGYYAGDDEAVIRQHARMLEAAGVDALVFDVSNSVTYDRTLHTLLRVFAEMRQHGEATPQIAFHCPFTNWQETGTRTLYKLYQTLYQPGMYPELWFRWQGKPLVIADPAYASKDALQRPQSAEAVELRADEVLGQTFKAEESFRRVGARLATWGGNEAGLTLRLRAGGPAGKVLLEGKFAHVKDGAAPLLELSEPLPAGTYRLEAALPINRVGWWSRIDQPDEHNRAFVNDEVLPSGWRRDIVLQPSEATSLQPAFEEARLTADQAADLSRRLLDFFTFRKPITLYNVTHPEPGAWAWLQVYPQAIQTGPDGKPEEMSVSVAQNYNLTVNDTAPMSVPGALGRSFRDGKLDPRPDAALYGFNFAEQWERALQVDPPLVFVTGWNEWTASLFDHWSRWQAPPPIFVDEFTEEFSRDIEPEDGPLGDNYYHQLTAAVRRYKGVRALPPVTQTTIPPDGDFAAWKDVQPEYRDAAGDPVHRDHVGYNGAGPCRNNTGRNDIETARVCCDETNVYFYVETRDPLTPVTDPDWMLLYLDTDHDAKTGWLGYDFVVNRLSPKDGKAYLERCLTPGKSEWGEPLPISFQVQGNRLQLTIPRTALKLPPDAPATLDFKWADHCADRHDWTDFTLNGDTAPDGRFNYRAVLPAVR